MIRKKSIALFIIILILSLAFLPSCKRKNSTIGEISARMEGKEIVWDAFEGAAFYSVNCTLTDGTGYSIRVSETSYTPPYAENGDHMYEIVALDKDGKMLAKSQPLLYHLGVGSYDDPILIASADELLEITGSTTVTFGEVKLTAPLYYRLSRDINLSGKEVTPIGDSSKTFGGVFDGAGHKITGLAFTKCNADGKIGLFGEATGAVIKNLTLENASMNFDKDSGVKNGDLRFGLLVGSATETYIDNCHVSGNMEILTKVVTSDSNKVAIGGIVGTATSGAITGCSFKGTIKAQYGWVYAGGILGEAKSSTPRFAMLNCAADAAVEGIGTAYNVTSGEVDAYARVGVIGGNIASAERIAAILATGSATAKSYRDGAAVSRITQGVFGRTLMSGSTNAIPFYHIFYDEAIGKVSGSATSIGTLYQNNVHALSAEALRTKASYLENESYGLNFEGTWAMTEGALPTLAGKTSLPHPPALDVEFRDKSGAVTHDFSLSEMFLPKCYPITLSRVTEYYAGYHLDSLLSSLNIAHAKGTRVRFSAEGLEDVEVEVGASNTLPYLAFAAYGAPENDADAFTGYKIIDATLLTTYDFTTAKKLTITMLPAESAE